MRNWRIGTFTAGMSLIILGVLWLLNQYFELPLAKILVNAWPVLLILIGAEIVLHHLFKKDEQIRFDFASIFLLIFLGIISIGVFTVQASGLLPAVKGIIETEKFSHDVIEDFDLDGVEELIIEVPNGEIELIGDQEERLRIDGELEVNAADQKEADELLKDAISYKKIGRKAYLEIKQPSKKELLVMYSHFKADLAINVPESVHVNLHVVNGDVGIHELANGAEVELVNGDLLIEESEGNFDVSNVNGEVEINQVSGNLEASLTNGDLLLEAISGEVTAKGINGSIEAAIDEINGDWELTLTNGEINLSIPDSEDITIDARSISGSVGGEVDWIRSNKKGSIKYEKEGRLVVGEGTNLIELSSNNGEITVDYQ